jgi:hypothetical protein
MSFFSCTCRKQLAALLACTSMAALSLSADDSNALSEDWLLTHNFYIAAVTGPWVGSSGNNFDYSYGGGYFTKSGEDLQLNNFYMSGLNVPAKLVLPPANTWEDGKLILDISGPLKINSQNINFPNKTVEIYACETPTLTTSGDDHTVIFKTKEEQPGTITFPLGCKEDGGTYWGIAWDTEYYEFVKTTYVFVIKDDDGTVLQYIPMTNPRYESVTEFDAPAYDYIDGRVVRKYMVDIMQNNVAFDLRNYIASGLNNISTGSCSNSLGYQISTGILYDLNRFIFHPKDNMQRRDYVANFEGSLITTETTTIKNTVTEEVKNEETGEVTTTTKEVSETVTVPVQPYFKFTYTGDTEVHLYRICSYDESEDHVYNGAAKDFINGYINYDYKTAKHNLEVTACPWVTNGGSRTTSTTTHIKFEMNGLKDQSTGEFIEKLDSTVILWNNTDCTLDLGLEISSAKYANSTYTISGSIIPRKKRSLVDHYELCMTPTDELSLNARSSEIQINTNLTLDASGEPYENGFANATNVSTAAGNGSSKIKRANATGVYFSPKDSVDFTVDLSASNLTKKSASDTYAFYLKAVYKDGTNLSPTFHSLQTAQVDGVISGIDDLCADAAISVRSQGNELIISGDFANVKVFTPAGKLVYDGNASQIPLSPGLYILNVDGRAFKKLIR